MISLLHPSRGRPQQAFNTAQKWIERAGVEVEYILSLDESDMYQKAYFEKYGFGGSDWPDRKGIHKTTTGFTCVLEDNKSVVEATNKAAKVSKGDILVYLSDDFDCPEGWGELVLKEFEDRPLLIKVDDCLQPLGTMVLTIPIMNRKLYERLGYFWHPEYLSMFVDEDLFWTTRKMGALKYSEHLKFPHIHPAKGLAPDDETYRRSSKNWDQGKKLFAQRRAQGFV